MLAKTDTLYKKTGTWNCTNSYSNLFLKVLQQNKFLLTLHERRLVPKAGRTFCLAEGLDTSFMIYEKNSKINKKWLGDITKINEYDENVSEVTNNEKIIITKWSVTFELVEFNCIFSIEFWHYWNQRNPRGSLLGAKLSR